MLMVLYLWNCLGEAGVDSNIVHFLYPLVKLITKVLDV